MVDLQTLFGYLTPISLTIGVIYHIMTLNNTRRNQQLTLRAQELAVETRQAQLYMNLYATYHSPEFRELLYKLMFHQEWKDYDEWNEKYGERNPPELIAYGSVMGYFNGLGLLVKKGLLDVDTVSDLLSAFIMRIWERHLPIVQAQRDNSNRPFWNGFEYLYDEIKKIDLQYQEL